MPELPEVQTTVDGINHTAKGKKILDVWTNYNSPFHAGKDNIKNPKFFKIFKKEIVGTKILDAKRVGKNILIELSLNPKLASRVGRASKPKTILIHMKMTGHMLYGVYSKVIDNRKKITGWVAEDKNKALSDPFNRFIHLVFSLSDGKQLAFSDMRKFAKVTLIDSGHYEEDKELAHIGPDALKITLKKFKEIYKNDKRPIKQALMDQECVAGIGNIYADEALWLAGIHPHSQFTKIPDKKMGDLYKASRKVLRVGINFGGDSMSDYRNIYGEPGKFQNKHHAYRKTGERCDKKGCGGKILRTSIGGRGAHFCNKHQKLFK